MPGFMEIGLPVPEKKIFDRFLPYRAWWPSWSVTSIMSSDFYFLVPESFLTKFGSERHCSF